MRIWFVLPQYLPDGLLYRQHQGIHGLLHGIVAGKPRRGVTRYLKFGGFVAWTHHLCVLEMLSRGGRHESYVDQLYAQIPENRRRFDYLVTRQMVARDKALIDQHMRRPGADVSMTRSTLPIYAAGNEFIDAQRRLITDNHLPNFALVM